MREAEMRIPIEEVRRIVKQSNRRMGLLYLTIAKEVISRFGDEGRDTLVGALRTFGRIRGERIAERVKREGKPLDLNNFFQHYDVPVHLSTNISEPQTTEDGELLKRVTICSLAELFKEEEAEEIGSLYCEQDFAMIQGYNEKITLRKGRSLMQGYDCCEFYYTESSSRA
jgi:hypothetical protein